MAESIDPLAIVPPRHVACAELTEVEGLVVWSLRRLVVARLEAADVEAAFRRAMAARHARPLILLKTLIGHLAISAKRKVSVGLPCRPCLTADEFALLIAIDAATAGDFVRAHSLFDSIAKTEQIDQLTHIAEALGEALADAGRPVTMLTRFAGPPLVRH